MASFFHNPSVAKEQYLFSMFLILFSACFFSQSSYAQSDNSSTKDLVFSIISEEDKTMEIFRGAATLTELIIPSQVEYEGITYTVVSIADDAFRSSNLVSVTIPNTVRNIGNKAFATCYQLKSVKISEIIENPGMSIGNWAFLSCKSLDSIEFSNSVISIGECAFSYCESLKSIDYMSNLKFIGYHSFYGCSSLCSLELPKSLEKIGEGAFRDCSSLESLEVAEGNQFFSSVNGILYDKDQTILLCWPAMKGNETIPSSVKTIGESALYPNNAVTSLVLPEGLEIIERWAFSDCSKLEEISFPTSLLRLDCWSIYGCPLIKEISLPSKVEIPQNILSNFPYCDALSSINVSPENPYYSTYDGVLYDKEGASLIKCPQAKTEIIFPETVTSLKPYCFMDSNIPRVILPETVSSIEFGAFASSEALESITILGEVKTIWHETFTSCWELNYVDLPASVTVILSGTFASCGGTINKFICRAPVPPSKSGCWSEQGDSHEPPEIRTYINQLFVPAESVELYMADSDWGAVARNIFPIEDEPGGVPGLGDEPAEIDFTVYTLTGIQLLKNASKEAISTLPSGIYIINGKKVAL